jgi:hypothetical protein
MDMEAQTEQAAPETVVDVDIHNVGSGIGVVYDFEGRMTGIRPNEKRRVPLTASMVDIIRRSQSKGGTLRVVAIDPLTGEPDPTPANPALRVLAEAADGMAYHELLNRANEALGGKLAGRPSQHEIIAALAAAAAAPGSSA